MFFNLNLSSILSLQTDELLMSLSCSVLFTLVCNVGAYTSIERLGCVNQITHLAHKCLAEGPPAEMFWIEEGECDLHSNFSNIFFYMSYSMNF